MSKESIPYELLKLLNEEEIMMFQELRIKIQELNYKTNLTRLIEGDDYWISQVSVTAFGYLKKIQMKFLIIKDLLMLDQVVGSQDLLMR